MQNRQNSYTSQILNFWGSQTHNRLLAMGGGEFHMQHYTCGVPFPAKLHLDQCIVYMTVSENFVVFHTNSLFQISRNFGPRQ